MPLISVVLPAHNAASTLGEAVETCLNQTHEDLELIVVDDASSDETASVLQAWHQRDERLRVLRSDSQLGVAAAFQLGFEEARGAWIARMDADDRNHPQRLEKQHALLLAEPTLAAASCLVDIRKRLDDGTLVSPEDGYARFGQWLNGLTQADQISRERFVDQPLVNPTMLMPRRTLEEHGGYRSGLDWAEDYDLWLRVLQAGGKIAKVPEILFTWTDHPHRLTRNHNDYTQDSFIRCKAYYLSQLDDVRTRGVAIGGAGPIGKAMTKALLACGTEVHHFYDVHPRRIGQRIQNLPVLGLESLSSAQDQGPILLAAVGQPGKRDDIRELAVEHGYREGIDFFAVA